MKKSAIICGGGASGFFAAINIAEKHPDYDITILEKSKNVLQKVKVSGGGRCNVTNERDKPSELVKFYPRGNKKLHSMFKQFSTSDMKDWLSKRDVKTKTEDDLRVFPVTDDSSTIINCFLDLVKKHSVNLVTQEGLKDFSYNDNEEKFIVDTTKGRSLVADYLIIATGSSSSIWNLLEKKEIEINPPVPSLFTFNIQDSRLDDLSGIAFDNVETKIAGTKLHESGPLLITHWGLSGPAVLKLSAWGARELAKLKYDFQIIVNFVAGKNFDQVREDIKSYKDTNPKKKVSTNPLFNIPKRYWLSICVFAEIREDAIYADLGKKSINKVAEELSQASFNVLGKSTFKEEFVTCGGVKLSEIDLNTMESKRYPKLFFTGEILDIDAITGGFNFQSCWSTAWLIGQNIQESES